MDLVALYAEMETKLRTVSGLRVVKANEKPQVPGCMILPPDSINPSTSYRGASVAKDVMVVVLVGKAVARQAMADALAYASHAGAKSISAVLDTDAPIAWANAFDVTLTEISFNTATIAGAPDVYLAVEFHLDITGPGA